MKRSSVRLLGSLLCLILLVSTAASCSKNTESNPGTENSITVTPALAVTQGAQADVTEPEATAAAEETQVNVTQTASGYARGELTESTDNYRTYYEVFVGSYCDSDQDGIGDFNGLTSKLDYIKDMGFDGIWLMPIHESPSYHKYDVIDYYTIDASYGTMEDFEGFMAACEERDIKVILDLVLNHTSTQCAWFKSAVASLAIEPCGQETCIYEELCREHNPYCTYYNFTEEMPQNSLTSYYATGNGWYYEGDFWSQMPDLNLDNEEVRSELEKAVDFWLEKGVGGFRLDAALHYFYGSPQKNIETLRWITDYVKQEDEDNYLVAEVWTGASDYMQYYESGIDSIFNFAFAAEDGRIVKTMTYQSAQYSGAAFGEAVLRYFDQMQAVNKDAIDAVFISNHDTSRAAGLFRGKSGLYKMGEAVSLFMNGSVFVYYGEDIGMRGSGIDENKRGPMYWSDTDLTGMTDGPAGMEAIENTFPPLDIQQQDETSINSYMKLAIEIRNQNPEIARGIPALVDGVEDADLCLMTKTYQGSTILLAYNFSKTETKTIDLKALGVSYDDLKAYLVVEEDLVSLSDGLLVLPACSIAVME